MFLGGCVPLCARNQMPPPSVVGRIGKGWKERMTITWVLRPFTHR